MRYKERASLTNNVAAKKLFNLMDQKETNLCVAADLTDFNKLIELINKIGNEICVLKTHIDIIENLPDDFAKQLLELKEKYDFLIFEDRKFADIGNTVKMQYAKGIYHIVKWADITNCHSVPGPGIIEGLQEVGILKDRGLLLLAQMSSAENLAQGKYTKKTITMAKQYDNFVIGFIGMKRLIENEKFITMTPGVKLVEGTDNLKQQYNTPTNVINDGSDVIIVGRGIYEADEPEEEAKKYREEGFNAYKKREKMI